MRNKRNINYTIMTCINTTIKKISALLVFTLALSSWGYGQEANPNAGSGNAYHNQLFFNRFLINPTFSLVRENKSYINILHRNQYATFDDNRQNYFLGFSNKLNDHSAVGIGVYSQWAGVIQEFGFNANYATSVRLGEKSSLAFGTNVTYFNVGLDKNRVVATVDDPELLEARKESKLAVQPGITLSVGRFDIGLYAEDLLKYNQTTNEFLTSLNDKSLTASVQYTHYFAATRGLFNSARLMPLVQLGKNEDSSLAYAASLLLDLPNYGWLQSALDEEYGMSFGLGFNISKKMSLGYLLEKDLLNQQTDLGWNHEVSLAYTFEDKNLKVDLYADGSEDQRIDQIIRNYEEQILQLTADKNNADAKNNKADDKKYIDPVMSEANANSLAYENRLILDELIFRQDSIEASRSKEIEQRFETIVRILRSDIKDNIKTNLNDIRFNPDAIPGADKSGLVNIKEPVRNVTETVKPYEKLPVKIMNQADMVGVKSGYYVIANVFKNKGNLSAFMKSLKQQGLDAKQFYNKDNGLYYVYLADYNYREEAETAYVSNLNGKYNEEKWIMQVDDPSATAENHYEDQ